MQGPTVDLSQWSDAKHLIHKHGVRLLMLPSVWQAAEKVAGYCTQIFYYAAQCRSLFWSNTDTIHSKKKKKKKEISSYNTKKILIFKQFVRMCERAFFRYFWYDHLWFYTSLFSVGTRPKWKVFKAGSEHIFLLQVFGWSLLLHVYI